MKATVIENPGCTSLVLSAETVKEAAQLVRVNHKALQSKSKTTAWVYGEDVDLRVDVKTTVGDDHPFIQGGGASRRGRR